MTLYSVDDVVFRVRLKYAVRHIKNFRNHIEVGFDGRYCERNRILKIARNGALAGPETENGHGNNHEPRIFSREESCEKW